MQIPIYAAIPEFSGPLPTLALTHSSDDLAESIPAMPATLVQLALLRKPQFIDLDAVTTLVRSDLGLCLQVLRAARWDVEGEDLWRISDCVVNLGPRVMDIATPLHPEDVTSHAFAEVEAFWIHSRLVAAAAEATALFCDQLGVNPEQAYLAGLLHNVRKLPELMGNTGAPIPASDAGSWISKCHLPSFVEEAINSVHEMSDPVEMSPLVRMVSFAWKWVELCLPWSETYTARRRRFSVPRAQVEALMTNYFPELTPEQLTPFIILLSDVTLDQLDDNHAMLQPRLANAGLGLIWRNEELLRPPVAERRLLAMD